MTIRNEKPATAAAPGRLSDNDFTTTDSSVLSLNDPEKQTLPPAHPRKTEGKPITRPSPSSSTEAVPANTADNIATNTTTTTPNNNNNDDGDDVGPEFDTPNPLTLHPSAATTIDFPEGGLTGWLVVLGSFCAMLSLFGLINSAAVFESYFSTHQLVDKTSSEIGWIFSLYLFIVFFVGIQVGPIFDRFGARVLVAVGGGLIFLSLLLLSWCEGTSGFI